jgi:hypothetical protein
MLAAWVFVAMARLPCLPVELGQVPAPVEVAPPVVAVLPPPPPPPPPPPAPLASRESARYTVEYGPLTIGEVHLSIAGARAGAASVSAGGLGAGGLLGLGSMENAIGTVFDLGRLDSRRWVDGRKGQHTLTDHVDQVSPGQVAFTRHLIDRVGTILRSAATLPGPLLDPLGFLLRLRVAPPGATPQVLYVLDGQALWRVTVSNAGRAPFPEPGLRVATIRLDAQADPIHYDGSASSDPDRRQRTFSVWLSDDAPRVPLRVEMPVGLSTVVVKLAEIRRS